jgi:aryl-alcohol dehydrogenase-like predicted oxidoreductase
MELRELGLSGIKIPPFVLGGNVFGWTADEAESFVVLDAYVAAGFTCIDTADTYSRWKPGNHGGESEAIIGRWLKARGQRGKMVIATKVGMDMGQGRKGLARRYIIEAVEASLSRLQTDYIDLYQSHVDDASTPLEETLEAHAQLIALGKVRAIGASNYTSTRLAEALEVSRRNGWPGYVTLQPNYNLYDRAPFESELGPLCVREHIGVIPYYALASGFLTGKYRSSQDLGKSPRGAASTDRFNDRGLRILATLDDVAADYRATPAQVALAWLLAQPAVIAPIASARHAVQLRELLGCVALRLSAQDLGRLTAASA